MCNGPTLRHAAALNNTSSITDSLLFHFRLVQEIPEPATRLLLATKHIFFWNIVILFLQLIFSCKLGLRVTVSDMGLGRLLFPVISKVFIACVTTAIVAAA